MTKGLTSFRALAFLAVYLFHAFGFSAGYLGVQAFFVLSGFLLTPILIEMKKNLDGRSYFTHFYGRRALRIFPLYYLYIVTVAVVCGLLVSQPDYSPIPQVDRFLDQLPWSLTYAYNFFHASAVFEHTHLVTHFWSLAVEEQFYLIWPFVIFLIGNERIKKCLLIIIALGPVLRWLLSVFASGAGVALFHDRVDVVIYVLPFSHFDAFATGGLLALYGRPMANWKLWVIMVFVLLFGFTIQSLISGGVRISSLGYPPFMREVYVWGYSLLNIAFALVLVQIRSGRFLVALFENRVLEYLGQISYGLYVFHFPILWATGYMWPNGTVVENGLTALLLTILVSALSYQFFERRFINLKDELFARAADGKTA